MSNIIKIIDKHLIIFIHKIRDLVIEDIKHHNLIKESHNSNQIHGKAIMEILKIIK
jgi:hypothetical protein